MTRGNCGLGHAPWATGRISFCPNLANLSIENRINNFLGILHYLSKSTSIPQCEFRSPYWPLIAHLPPWWCAAIPSLCKNSTSWTNAKFPKTALIFNNGTHKCQNSIIKPLRPIEWGYEGIGHAGPQIAAAGQIYATFISRLSIKANKIHLLVNVETWINNGI